MKSKDIDEIYFKPSDTPPTAFNRRDFLKKLGGGIIITFSVSELAFAKALKGAQADEIPDFNAYLRVKEDGTIDCFSGKIEMGQGINTSLAQVLADELEVPMDKVKMIMGDTELVPYDKGTWGSLTTRFHDPLIRAAAAEARQVLIELASQKLDIPVSQLEAKDGKVVAMANESKYVAYEKLTEGKKIIRSLSTKPELKKPKEFDVIGKSYLRVDGVEKVTGKAKYSADIQLPGMLYARIIRPEAVGSTLLSANTSKAEAIEGVKVVKEDDLIAVLHSQPEKAEDAMYAVEARWEAPEVKADNESIFTHILNYSDKSRVRHSSIEDEKGKNLAEIILAEGKKLADVEFDEEYHDGYKAHASIETHTATAVFKDGKLTMWASSQTPFGTREDIAKKLNLPEEKVHLKQIYIGGGFGGKIYNQQAMEAAILAKKLVGTPVQVMWSRKEEFMYDRFRSAAVVKIKSGVARDGKITYFIFDAYASGARGTDMFYSIPNHLTTTYRGDNVHQLFTGAWRAPGNPTNTFARESHFDMMAHKIGMDPLEFRIKNMGDHRAMRSLEVAAEKFNWENYKPSKNKGRGIAIGYDAGTYVTIIAEVEVNTTSGAVKVIRTVVGQDMGQVINPEGVDIQAEGCVNMGLGYSLTEDIEFEGGVVKNENFSDYQLPVFSMIPEVIESVTVDAMDEKAQGGGEPAIVSVGGAIANAVFDACGARVNRLPITPERVLNALKKSSDNKG